MGRLFWKFLLAFWLTLIMAGAGVAVVVSWLHQRDADGDPRRRGDPHAATLVSAGAAVLRHGGAEGLRTFLEEIARTDPMPLLALDASGRDILGRSATPDEIDGARRLAAAPTVFSPARRVVMAGQEWLLFVPASALSAPVRAPPGFRPGGAPGGSPGPGRQPPSPWIPIGAAMIASLLFSALLAWYVAQPIRRLREATRAVAAGKLDTRIGPAMGGRRDELAELGHDFDAMTGQLDGLIGAQSRLFHDVSHELRSPLARLHAAIGLARQRPEQLGDTLDRLEREAGRLDELVGEVLTLARLDSGMAGSEPVEFDIGDLLEAILDDVRFEAEAIGRRVDCSCMGHARVLGRADLIGRAIENVIRNALRYTPTGGNITLDSRFDVTTGVFGLSVSDQGPGVDEDELDAIFVPFHRGRRAKNNEGYGLGLAIARRAVEIHGGTIQASNRAEGGLRIAIELPAMNP